MRKFVSVSCKNCFSFGAARRFLLSRINYGYNARTAKSNSSPAFARALVHRALLLHARITRNLHRIETNDIKMPNKIATLPCLAVGLLLPADASRGRKMLCLSTNNESCAPRSVKIFQHHAAHFSLVFTSL
jgi:hypothetical protein